MIRRLRKHRAKLGLLSIAGLMLRLALMVVTLPAAQAVNASTGAVTGPDGAAMTVVICTTHGTMTVPMASLDQSAGTDGAEHDSDESADGASSCPLCSAVTQGLLPTLDATPLAFVLDNRSERLAPVSIAPRRAHRVRSHAPRGPPTI